MPRTTGSECPHCGRPYRTFEIPPLIGTRGRVIALPCDCDGARAEERDSRRGERQTQLRTAWRATGVPERYMGVDPDLAALPTIESGTGMYICGPRGTGKTRAACAVLKAYVARHTSRQGWCSARFVSVPRWLDSMQDAYDRRGASAEDAFQTAAGCSLLVLDDLGKVTSRVSDWTVGKLFRLVDERYNAMRPTVYTSQYKLSELAARLTPGTDTDTPDAMISRIFETCVQMLMDGPDRRMGDQ